MNLEGAIIGENSLFRGRRVSLLEGGAPYLLRRAPSWAKGASSYQEGDFAGGKAPIA